MLCLALIGCTGHGSAALGKPLVGKSTLQPAALPGENANLIMAGVKVPVKVIQSNKDGVETLDFVAHGATIETEVYQDVKEAFRVLRAGEEEFKPGIDLLHEELHQGDTWTWTGEISNAGKGKPAKAKITIDTANLVIGQDNIRTVNAVVDLSLNADPGMPPVLRRLTFWFAEGKGVIKREFGKEISTSREPVKP